MLFHHGGSHAVSHVRVFAGFERAMISERVRAGWSGYGQTGCESLISLHRREILWQRDTAPSAGRQFCGSAIACCCFARRDVHLRALRNEAGGYHPADASGAAGDGILNYRLSPRSRSEACELDDRQHEE
jgi:hypothetical protein